MNWKLIWKPVLALVLACGILLSLSGALAETKAAKQQEHDRMVMGYLLMDSETFTEEAYSGEDTAITAVYKGETGYVVETTVDGKTARGFIRAGSLDIDRGADPLENVNYN